MNYPQLMFLGVLNTTISNISYSSSHLDLRICSIQIVVIMRFVIKSNVDIKRVDCIMMR